MRIIICGAGQVGWQIARHLSNEHNHVTVVDSNPDLVARATDTLDVSGIIGSASYPDVLSSAGAEDADMIIAATQSDEVNMITCQIAHSVFQVPRKIARLRSKSYLDAIYSDLFQRDHLPIDVVISPEHEVAHQALMQFTSPATFETEPFLDNKVELMGLDLDETCNVLHTPLQQLSELFHTLRAMVVGIRRDGELIVPDRNAQLYAGDEIYICTHAEDKARCLEVFGKSSENPERVVIVGGGSVGRNIAQEIEQSGAKITTKIIERDRKLAEKIADNLDKTVVLHGDGMNLELLQEANVKNCDGVLAVTDDDKTNLLVAARAKIEGAPLAIALINDSTLINLKDQLGIDAFVNPKTTTVSSILRHIRHGRVRAVYSVGDAEAEIIEAQILSSSPIAGQKIRDIEWPDDSIIAMVQHQDEVMRPTGDTRLLEGDLVVIFTKTGAVHEVERLFQVNMDFF